MDSKLETNTSVTPSWRSIAWPQPRKNSGIWRIIRTFLYFTSSVGKVPHSAEPSYRCHPDSSEASGTCRQNVTAQLLAQAAQSRPLVSQPSKNAPKMGSNTRNGSKVGRRRRSQISEPNDEFLDAQAKVFNARGQYNEAISTYTAAVQNASSENKWQRLNDFAGFIALYRPTGTQQALGMINEAIAKKGPQPELLNTRAMVYTAAKHMKKPGRTWKRPSATKTHLLLPSRGRVQPYK